MKFVNDESNTKVSQGVLGADLSKGNDFSEIQPVVESRPVEPEKPKIIEPTRSYAKLGKVNRIANMRVTPNTTADILDVVMIGAKVDILGTDRNYYKVSYNSNTGYILKNCVDEIW